MELWDVYDSTMEATGRSHQRGIPLDEGDYHLIVLVFPVNAKGELLIQKRAATVVLEPGLWAATGGSAVRGENHWQACQRELKEELGLDATKENAELIMIYRHKNRFSAVWIVHSEVSISELTLQKEEVEEARWATVEEIREMMDEGRFHRYTCFEWIADYIRKNNECGVSTEKR